MKKIDITKLNAFTLIEVLIVILLLAMLLTATYAPYSHYQKKALLKQAVKEITQSVYEARNLAINGLNVGGSNVSVGLYMDASTDDSKVKLSYYSYPFGTTPSALPTGSANLIKTKDLPNGVWLETIEGVTQFIFLYDAISGDGTYYSGNGAGITPVTDSEVDINVSYKGATTSTLQGKIDYYTDTYIANY